MTPFALSTIVIGLALISVCKSLHIAKLELPMKKEVSGGLHYGNTIQLDGKLSEDAEKVVVNLVDGDESNRAAEMPLHVVFRFGKEPDITIDGQRSGSIEEQVLFKNDLKPGERFSVRIVATHKGYMILINKEYLTVYPFEEWSDVKANSIVVDGDLDEVDLHIPQKAY